MINIRNLAVLVGNLGKDPKDELKKTQTGLSVCTVSIAVDDGLDATGNRKTIWVPVETWRNTAEYLAEKCHKGDTIGVTGKLSISQYIDRDGNNKERWKIVADSIQKLKESPNYQNAQAKPAEPAQSDFPDVGIDVDMDELPF